MALTYKSKTEASNPDAQKNDFLYKAACAIQTYIDDATSGPLILCLRMSDGSVEDSIIECSCHPDEKSALQHLKAAPKVSKQHLVDYMLGTREDFIEALTWPV